MDDGEMFSVCQKNPPLLLPSMYSFNVKWVVTFATAKDRAETISFHQFTYNLQYSINIVCHMAI